LQLSAEQMAGCGVGFDLGLVEHPDLRAKYRFAASPHETKPRHDSDGSDLLSQQPRQKQSVEPSQVEPPPLKERPR